MSTDISTILFVVNFVILHFNWCCKAIKKTFLLSSVWGELLGCANSTKKTPLSAPSVTHSKHHTWYLHEVGAIHLESEPRALCATKQDRSTHPTHTRSLRPRRWSPWRPQHGSIAHRHRSRHCMIRSHGTQTRNWGTAPRSADHLPPPTALCRNTFVTR